MADNEMPVSAILVFKMGTKIFPGKDFTVMNIFCKFQKSSYNIFFYLSSNGEIFLVDAIRIGYKLDTIVVYNRSLCMLALVNMEIFIY